MNVHEAHGLDYPKNRTISIGTLLHLVTAQDQKWTEKTCPSFLSHKQTDGPTQIERIFKKKMQKLDFRGVEVHTRDRDVNAALHCSWIQCNLPLRKKTEFAMSTCLDSREEQRMGCEYVLYYFSY